MTYNPGDTPQPGPEQQPSGQPYSAGQPAGQPSYGPGGGQPPYGQPYGTPAPQPEMSPSDQKLWATLVHLSGLFIAIGPLIGYLLLKDRGQYVADQSREALNFQITVLIAVVVGTVTSVIGIGLIILFAAWVVGIVFAILAAVQANKGVWYRYPISWRIVH